MSRRSEFALIAAFRERLPGPHAGVVVGSGDDAAVVRAGGALSVVSVDTTVDGVHARLDLGDPIQSARDFGWRGLTTALSDLAACGVGAGPGPGPGPGPAMEGSSTNEVLPPEQDVDADAEGRDQATTSLGIEVYVAVTLPNGLGDERILAIADGMAEAARAYGVSVIGGDVTAGPVAVMSTTVVGWLDDPPLTRAGAQPGDLVGLTGTIGAAGAGLALTIGEVAPHAAGDAALAASLRTAYQRPVPHLAAGAALRALGATAAIDLSDGLAADALHVAEASGVVLALDADAIPIAEGVVGVAAAVGRDPLVFAQSAGEDFALLVTVPPSLRTEAEAAGVVAWIGRVEAPVGGAAQAPAAAPTESAGSAGGAPRVTGLPADPSGRAGHDHRS